MAKNFVCTTTEPIVQTKAGKLRGFILDGTYTFYGIKYADAKRFQQPTRPNPGKGSRTPSATAMSARCSPRTSPVPAS